MDEDTAGLGGIDGALVVDLLAEGATACRHPSGSCVMLTLTSGPPSLMLDCDLMDQLVTDGTVFVDDRGVYRLRHH